ncbi:hypothetical protein HOT99_gp262 [Caulobacter phage CcrBL10]|uniref:Uncharacterized protein n=1 Tax=Caulobacter phage CcrBL10 TaxID=2283269 RepID=A0A385EBJ5_9CAUD|nr:hypothetical protein HOT99_gp262 [Caulobacter phage CcrBL10]AXQ68355.1 hypothetical protein CcrBL10_gp151c [Caulobacter phage CcrBL10]
MNLRDRIAEIADDFHPDRDEDAAQALDEMRSALKAALADCLTPKDEAFFHGCPEDIRALLIRQADDEAYERARIAAYTHSVKESDGRVVHYAGEMTMPYAPVDSFFGLGRAAWFTLPRMSIQEMPPPWQQAFFDLIAAGEKMGLVSPEVEVSLKRKGRYATSDHWNNYRYGNTQVAQAIDEQQ